VLTNSPSVVVEHSFFPTEETARDKDNGCKFMEQSGLRAKQLANKPEFFPTKREKVDTLVPTL
jgi:hypothetical protein